MVRIHETVEWVWDSCLDSASFLGIGYLSGRMVNWFTKWSSVSSFFTKSAQIDLTSAAVCCALFATIDRIAYNILNLIIEDEELEKPAYSACRIMASAAAAVTLLNIAATHLKISSLDNKSAVAVILTAIVIYSQIVTHLNMFNLRYQ